jgi:hypothetical protein
MDYIPVPESIRCVANSADRQLAWHFFIFFSRFEYALKRDQRYLKPGIGDAEPNWDRFASDHNKDFFPESLSELKEAVEYFITAPPRKQLRAASIMSWSEPQKYDEKEPLLIWLLRMIRCIRNNLFHGGKFPLIPISDPSRDRELLLKAMVILKASLTLDAAVEHTFGEGLDE